MQVAMSNVPRFKSGRFHVFSITKSTTQYSRNPSNAYGRETLW
jgi:hypothetical protein